jgi:hypothetical protein
MKAPADTISVAEAARRLKISTRRVRVLAGQGRLPGAVRHVQGLPGRGKWAIPSASVAAAAATSRLPGRPKSL